MKKARTLLSPAERERVPEGRVRVLAVDTASETMSLAVFDGRKVWEVRSKARDQDERLHPLLKTLLKKSKLRLDDIDAFAAASGPGRFTGIRVGMTFAGILARVRARPAVAVTRLEAAAARGAGLLTPEAAGNGPAVCAVFPSAREELFFQVFPGGAPAWTQPGDWPAKLRAAAKGRGVLLVGPAAEAASRLLGKGEALVGDTADVSARDLVGPALRRLACGDPGPFAALYLKPAYYERPRA